jgi:hypothetical protein
VRLRTASVILHFQLLYVGHTLLEHASERHIVLYVT